MSVSPAYHLRRNKTVERLLFIELLHKLDRGLARHVSRCKYVGLGGPYLEDFSLLHGVFGSERMTSLEIKSHVLSRQAINQPHSQIDLLKQSTTQFVEEYAAKAPSIVWFDFEWPDWEQQIAESCDLLRRLAPMSIFKLTLSGKTEWLGSGEHRDPLEHRAQALSEMFEDFGPFSPADVNAANVCGTLYRIFRLAAAEAVPDTEQRCVRSVASYEYNDGTPILTITMVVGSVLTIQNLIEAADLENWPFSDVGWHSPKRIDVPALSVREKLAVDQLLPRFAPRTILKKLKLRLADTYEESLRLMQNYVECYRHVPHFVRVAI